MFPFQYKNNSLHCDSVALTTLAQEFGTPLYVYSANRVRENFRRLVNAFAKINPTICYSVKANSNLSLLKILKDEGASFDIVSGGELFRVLKINADAERIVFAGVGKTESEIDFALQSNVGWINVESEGELIRVNQRAHRLGVSAVVAIRLRPDVDAATHHHISTGHTTSKFGVPVSLALEMTRMKLSNVKIRGAHIHIGSQLGNPEATLKAIEVALDFVARANQAGAEIDALDVGGGFPVAYRADDPKPDIESFAAPIVDRLSQSPIKNFHLEPGRFIIADTAALMTTVQYVKDRIAIVDAGMQTLIRPALYEAYHEVMPVVGAQVRAVGAHGRAPLQKMDIAGPICESSDFLARDRELPNLKSGDLLAFTHAGAYGFSMASNYNSHPLPAEVLVENDSCRVIRRRQTYNDLIINERLTDH
ncbi:MAG: diaminopimelate decarboxylase [Chloroflexi bacterium]|nr:diaminopimelate decarboxylase [Chloroflexota bacterium]